MKKTVYLFLICLCIVLIGCYVFQHPVRSDNSDKSSVRTIQSMDTIMQITAFGPNREAALDACEAEIHRLNDLLSTGLDSSEISQINRDGRGVLSYDSSFLVHKAIELYYSTDGAFDITVYPLTKLWGFPSKEYHVPSEAEISVLLPCIGSDKIEIDGNSIVLGPMQSIDLGGIAKGYTSHKLMELFRNYGVKSAMVSLGGNVQCLGTKPNGQKWKIGIQTPWHGDSGIYAVVQVENEAVITSGGYERFFEDPETGHIYRHILDTSTGYPAESGLASVTIVTPDGTLGDGLSTSLYVMGLDKAIKYWSQHRSDFEMIIICDNGDLFVTQGLRDRITSIHNINFISSEQKEDAK